MTNVKQKAPKKWVRGAATALVALALVLVVWVFSGLSFFGLSTYNITNGSMNPTVPTASKVFVVEQSEYQSGDIITFDAIEIYDSGPIVVTHRLVGFNDDETLITQGDANKSVDYPAVPVYATDIHGKVVFHIPVVGGVQEWMKAYPLVWIPLVGIALLIMFIWPSKKRTSRDDDEPTDLQEEETVTRAIPVA